jgi:fatty acid desaturase
VSENFWYQKHNEHHKHVNHVDKDPDIDFPFIFRKIQLGKVWSVSGYILKYQHFIFFFVLPFYYFLMVVSYNLNLFRTFNFKNFVDLFFILVHFSVLFYWTFASLSILNAFVFLFVTFMAAGIYMTMVFAPNHKGMDILEGETKWYHQIILTRNLFPNKVVFHMMGGLNYQIEHHLFSNVARINLPRIGEITKKFCKENDLPYHETTWWGSVKEIYVSLKENSVLYKNM